jgi:hypothetical protein
MRATDGLPSDGGTDDGAPPSATFTWAGYPDIFLRADESRLEANVTLEASGPTEHELASFDLDELFRAPRARRST